VRQRIAEKKRLWARDPIFWAVSRIIACKGQIGVKALASEMCMSLRSFEQQFLLKAGVRPKTYANIWRFQAVMQLLQSRPRQGLGNLVHEAGYYDVPHFLKDLKKKTGEGYEAYLKKIPDLASTFLHAVQDQKVVAFLQ
jgi:methylphosphotriester-DNA--protein-cysteine methyltransferase